MEAEVFEQEYLAGLESGCHIVGSGAVFSKSYICTESLSYSVL